MTVSVRTAIRAYHVHGVEVQVHADSPAVIEAVELRLRGFPRSTRSRRAVRFEFVTASGLATPLDEPQAVGRPVYETEHGTLFYSDADDILHGAFGGVTLRCEAGHGRATMYCAAFSDRDLYLATHPLLTICMMELMERRGRFSVHAACLAHSEHASVLIAGPSGSGKSTLSLALASSGMTLLSDDVVFLARDDAGVRALGFADALGLSEAATGWLPELAAAAAAPPPPGFPKRLLRPEQLFRRPAPALRHCVPRALVFPEVVPDEASTIAPLDPGEALLRLVPDILLTNPDATQAHLAAIASLLAQVGCFRLVSGQDLMRGAELISALAALSA